MKDKELSKLSRIELLEMLVEQSKEVQRLQNELEEAKKELAQREIKIKEAGSIAEASLQLNHVFEAAQQAANQYLENIQQLDQKYSKSEIELESQRKAQELLLAAQQECEYMKEETLRQCKQKINEAKRQIQDEWLTFNEYRKRMNQGK